MLFILLAVHAMNKFFLNLFACVVFSCCFSTAFADDPVTITVTGTVVASPCEVDPENVANNIDLGDLQASSLATAGSWVSQGVKAFHVKLINCPAGTSSVTATFHGTPSDVAGFTDRYKNIGTAQNVVVGLQWPDGVTQYSDGATYATAITEGGADFYLQAYVMATGQSTPGSINSTITMSFAYN